MSKSFNITYDELLTLLLRRENEYKSLLEYAIETKTIKPEILVKILNHQSQNHCTFQESFTVILGDNFTKKYLKLYSSQIPSLYSIWTDQAPFLKKLIKLDHRSGNSEVTLFHMDPSSNLLPIDPQNQAPEKIETQNIPHSIDSGNRDTVHRNDFDLDEDDDDDDFQISAYEEPELIRKSSFAQRDSDIVSVVNSAPVPPQLTAVDQVDYGSENEIDELDISETKALKELSNSEKAASGFQLPTLFNEPIDKSLLSDFLEFFDDHQRNTIENLILSTQNKSGKELSYVFNSLYREFHSLKGSSRFCKLKLFEMVTHYIEDLITDVQQKMASFDKATRDQFEESLLLGMDVLWELKQHINEYKSEKSIDSNSKLINKTHHLWLAIAKTRFNLRFSAAS